MPQLAALICSSDGNKKLRCASDEVAQEQRRGVEYREKLKQLVPEMVRPEIKVTTCRRCFMLLARKLVFARCQICAVDCELDRSIGPCQISTQAPNIPASCTG